VTKDALKTASDYKHDKNSTMWCRLGDGPFLWVGCSVLSRNGFVEAHRQVETRNGEAGPSRVMEVFEASGTLFGRLDLPNRRPVTPLKINTPEPPSEATVPLSAAFTSKG
jgi:hypothetical protein